MTILSRGGVLAGQRETIIRFSFDLIKSVTQGSKKSLKVELWEHFSWEPILGVRV